MTVTLGQYIGVFAFHTIPLPPLPMKIRSVCLLVALVAPLVHADITWDGSTSGNWNTSANWGLVRIPSTTERVVFPSGAANLTMNNNLPVDAGGGDETTNRDVNRLSFTGAGYTVNGAGIDLVGSSSLIDATHASGVTTFNVPIQVPDTATLRAEAGATLRLNSTADITLTNAVGTDLTLDSDGLIDINSSITGTGGVLVVGSFGTVRFDGPQLFTDSTIIDSSSVELVLTSTHAGDVYVRFGELGGTGTINGNLDADQYVSPGDGGPGRLTVNGYAAFATTRSTLNMELNGTTPATGYDQLRVGGIFGANALLNLIALKAFPLGTTFVLIDKTSAGAISGNFRSGSVASSVPVTEGFTKDAGGNRFQFSYIGGNGNDFTATVIEELPDVWDGTDLDDLFWSSPGNWSDNTLPLTGQVLRFGSVLTADVATINNIGGTYERIEFVDSPDTLFSGIAFSITPSTPGGQEITLNDGIITLPGPGNGSTSGTVNNNLFLAGDQEFALTGEGALTIGGSATVNLGDNDIFGGNILTLRCQPIFSSTVMNLDATVTGLGSLVKTGPGRLQMGGTSAASNSYSGTTDIQQGELRLTRTGSANCIPGDVTIGDGTNSASLRTTVANKIADTADVTVKPNGTFSPGSNETITDLVIDGGAVNCGATTLSLLGKLDINASIIPVAGRIAFSSVAAQEISVDPGLTLTLSPDIEKGIGTLRKTGTGTLAFVTNEVTANLAVEAGTVNLNGIDGQFSQQGANFTLSPAGTLTGIGTMMNLNAAAGGTIQPNFLDEELVCDSFTGGASATFKPLLDSGNSDLVGRLRVQGSLSLANTRLDPVMSGSVPVGTSFIIVQKDSAGVTSSRFTSTGGVVLNEGALVTTTAGVFRLSYQGGSGNDITLTSAAPVISISTNPAGVTEGQVMSFTISLSFAASSNVSVNFATGNSQASAPGDFTAQSGTLVFTPGQTGKTVNIQTFDDSISEYSESLRLDLSNPVNATLAASTSGGIPLIDNDPEAVATVSVNISASEAVGTVGFTVTLDRLSEKRASVTVSSSPGSAGVADFSGFSTPTRLEFGANELVKTVTLGITNDTTDEPAESFGVSFSYFPRDLISGGELPVVSARTMTITDNDPPPVVSISTVGGLVGENVTPRVFTVALSQASAFTVTVNFATENSSAVAPGDYMATSGSLTFLPEQTSKTVNVTVIDDNVVETTESFGVRLSNAVNASIGSALATATIEDNDSLPILTVTSQVIVQAVAGSAARFSAAVTGPPGATVFLEASSDLGVNDPWQVIGQIVLDGSGLGTFTNVEDPGSIGAAKNFFRLRID